MRMRKQRKILREKKGGIDRRGKMRCREIKIITNERKDVFGDMRIKNNRKILR